MSETSIHELGVRCPAPMLKSIMENNPKHRVEIITEHEHRLGVTVGEIALHEDGAAVWWDDGTTIVQRLTDDADSAIEAFREIVSTHVDECETRGLDPEVDWKHPDKSPTDVRDRLAGGADVTTSY